MLRITQINDLNSASTFKLEGKLVGPWVTELARAWGALQCPADHLRLDLSAVTFVDGAGMALLRDLLGRGAKLAACSGLITELLCAEKR